MTNKNLFLALLTIGFTGSSVDANPLTDLDEAIKSTIGASLGDYAWVTTAGILTAGSLYSYYKTKQYNAHAQRFSLHEILQDQYDLLCTIEKSYSLKKSTHALCQAYAHTTNTELADLQNYASNDLSQLTSNHQALAALRTTITSTKKLQPLVDQYDYIVEHYKRTEPQLREFIRQIPYIKAQNFLSTHQYLNEELHLLTLSPTSALQELNDIIHSRSHGRKRYPYRSYSKWLSTLQTSVRVLTNDLRGFRPEPFQRETITLLNSLSEALNLTATRVKGSREYKKECAQYEEECRHKERQARRRQKAARIAAQQQQRLALERQKLNQMRQQTQLMQQQAAQEAQRYQQYQAPQQPAPSAPPIDYEVYTVPPTRESFTTTGPAPSAPRLADLNSPYTAPPTYSTDQGPVPSAPPLDKNHK